MNVFCKLSFGALALAATLLIAPNSSRAAPSSDAVRSLYERAQQLMDHNEDPQAMRQARRLIMRMARSKPRTAEAYVAAGRYSYRTGYINSDKFDRKSLTLAHEAFDKAIALDPDFFDAYLYAGYAFVFDKDEGKAAQMAAKARSLAPDSPEVDLLLGHVANLKNNDQEVEQRAQQVLQKSSETKLRVSAEGLLIKVYERQQRHELAEQAHQRILTLEPRSPSANINYSNFLLRQGEYDKSIAFANRALSISDFGVGHLTLAAALYRKGVDLYWKEKQPEKAQKYFEQSVKHNPRDPDAQYCLGLTLYKVGHATKNVAMLKQAEASLTEALRLKPGHEEARTTLDQLNKLLEWVKHNKAQRSAV